MTESLAVLLYGRVVGYLERDSRSKDPRFRYDREYQRDGEVAISAALPISDVVYSPARIRPYLRGLLPERLETRRLWAEELGASPDDVFGLLSRMGWDCPGAIQFCDPAEVDELMQRESEYRRLRDSDIAQRLRGLREHPASWHMPDEHWSLGGQQEKFALAKVNGVWHEAHGSAATTHIFKPGIAELKHQALVEHATMVAANELGVDVATSQLLQFEEEWAIVVSRFDRIADDHGVSRIHQEDFCQALRREPEEKYETHGGPGLLDMMRVVKQQSTARSDDVLALADFAAINLVAGAPDGHAKNISMLRVPQQRTIAPLYDLATGLAYDRGKVDRSIAVSIGGERFVSRIRRSQWLKAAQVLGLPADELRSRVAALAAGFPDAFGKALRAVEQAPGALEVAERALPRLEHHCDRIQAQL